MDWNRCGKGVFAPRAKPRVGLPGKLAFSQKYLPIIQNQSSHAKRQQKRFYFQKLTPEISKITEVFKSIRTPPFFGLRAFLYFPRRFGLCPKFLGK